MQKLMILAALVTGLLTFPMQSGAAKPTTLVVDEHGRGCVAGDRVFRTIQEAIDTASTRVLLTHAMAPCWVPFA